MLLLDEQPPNTSLAAFAGFASRRAKLRGLCFFRHFLWNKRAEECPGVDRIQRVAKGCMKLVGRELARLQQA